MKDDNCEHDCKNVCVGCDRTFCEIKDEIESPHDEELPCSGRFLSGENYCHRDCIN